MSSSLDDSADKRKEDDGLAASHGSDEDTIRQPQTTPEDEIIVDWDGPDDPQNPKKCVPWFIAVVYCPTHG